MRPDHATDAQLVEHYFAAEAPERAPAGVPGGSSADSRDAWAPQRHLSTCASCRDRYRTLVQELEAIEADGVREADLALPPDVLARQHHAVMRRLENLGRRADIRVFPARLSRHVQRRMGTRHPVRWAAAAALVGLAVGLTLGLALDRRGGDAVGGLEIARVTSSAGAAGGARGEAGRAAGLSAAEDALLDEIDAALLVRRVPELLPYDELTPERVSITYRTR